MTISTSFTHIKRNPCLNSFQFLGIDNLSSNVDIIVANVTDRQSLIDMCHRTTILLDCVGPVRVHERMTVCHRV
jgi:hypothetical protein